MYEHFDGFYDGFYDDFYGGCSADQSLKKKLLIFHTNFTSTRTVLDDFQTLFICTFFLICYFNSLVDE